MHALTFLLCAPFSCSQPLVLIDVHKPATALMYMMCLAATEPILSGFEVAKIYLSARTIQHIHKYDM